MRWNLVVATLLAAVLSFVAFPAANAATLICNNCDLVGYRNRAVTAGTGDHFVTDYGKSILTRWIVYYDKELGGWMAEPADLEPWQKDAFAGWAQVVKLSGRLSPQVELVINVGSPLWEGMDLNPTFNDANAFLLARNRTLRTDFARAFGAAIENAGLSTSSVLGFLTSTRLKDIKALVPNGTVTITFVWSDGSKTVFTIDENTVSEPVYIPGRSRASNNAIVPDETAVPGTAISCPQCYVGDHFLSNGDDLQRWFDNARLFGINIVDPGATSGPGSISCSWDGETLTCKPR